MVWGTISLHCHIRNHMPDDNLCFFLIMREKEKYFGTFFFVSFHFIITKKCFKTLSYIKLIVFMYFLNEWGFGEVFVSKITRINKNTRLFYRIIGKQTSACNIFLIRCTHVGILWLHCKLQCADSKPSSIYANNPNALVMLGELFNKVVVNITVVWGNMTWRNMLTETMGAKPTAPHLWSVSCWWSLGPLFKMTGQPSDYLYLELVNNITNN